MFALSSRVCVVPLLAVALAFAAVQQTNDIPQGEKDFVKIRHATTVRQCIDRIVGGPAPHIPNIAIAGSGGGFRAMLASWGAYQEMDNLGLFDCVTYNAGVSGSTWSVSALAYRGFENSTKAFASGFNEFDLSINEIGTFITDLQKLKWAGAITTVVDFWAYCLATNAVLKGVPDAMFVPISKVPESVLNGETPFPIISMMEVNGTEPAAEYRHFMEATPYWFGSQDFSAWLPIDEFCQNGKVCTLPSIFGTASSAFEVSPEYIIKHFLAPLLAKLKKEKSLLAKVETGFVQWLEDFVKALNFRLDPQEFKNFMLGLEQTAPKGAPFPTTENIMCVDQGIFENIPLPSTMMPTRAIDVIIALDQSEFIEIGEPDKDGFLRFGTTYAKEMGYKFPPINITGLNTRACTVFQDPSDPAVPIVVYVPLRNASNPYVSLEGTYPTLKLAYSASDVAELISLSRFNIAECAPKLRAAFKTAATR